MSATSTAICAFAHPRAASRGANPRKFRPFKLAMRGENNKGRQCDVVVRSLPNRYQVSPSGRDDNLLRSSNTEDILRRLHITFLATRRGSRFAAQEFAMVATEAYERGVSIPTLRMDISLLGLSTENRMGMSEQDAFLSNIGMAMMTLYELQWPSYAGGEGWCPMGDGVDPEEDREARGLLAYIRATHQRSDQGFTLKRMEMERMMALSAYDGEGEFELEPGMGEGGPSRSAPKMGKSNDRPVSQTGIGGGSPNPARAAAMTESPAVALMRVNCRITLLLREMVFIERGLRPVTEVVSQAEMDQENEDLLADLERNFDPTEEIERVRKELDGKTPNDPTNAYINNLTNSDDDSDEEEDEDSLYHPDYQAPQLALEWCRKRRNRARNVAARGLTAYVSSLTTHPVGLRAFAAAAVDGYISGIPARDVTSSLVPEEFDVEGSRRGMFGSAADATRFFSLFITTAYITAEQDACAQANNREQCDMTMDPDGFAWAPAPGEFRKGSEVPEEARRTVAGMRDSVEAWMEMDRQDLKAAVASQLSVDEDEDVLASADFDADEVLQSARVKPAGSAKNLPPGDLEWQADPSLANNSITVACLTLQRMVVSFTLRELARRRCVDNNSGADFDSSPEYGNGPS